MSLTSPNVAQAPAPRAESKEEQPYIDPERKRYTAPKLLAVLVFWGAAYGLFKGEQTLVRGFQDLNSFDRWLNDIRDWLQFEGKENWFFGGVLGGIGDGLNAITEFLQRLISIPAFPWPFPIIGWLGVAAILLWLAYAAAGRNSTILVAFGLLIFGCTGLWSGSMDLLIITFLAVLMSVVIGIPVGIWMSRSKTVSTLITPVLDTMQTMPSFAYLGPIALFFGIGPASAIVLTWMYAIPPLIRITEHGMRTVPENTLEAARSLGLTKGQLLRQVELPMARRTIVVGINQCMMAALSMATIAALVNGPGLGKNVTAALQTLNVGAAAVGGLGIVVMAIVLDRTITAASQRAEVTGRGQIASTTGFNVMLMGVALERLPRWASEERGAVGSTRKTLTAAGRWLLVGFLLVPVAVAVWLSRYDRAYAEFPDVSETPVLKYLSGQFLTVKINDFTAWFVDTFSAVTLGFKDAVSYGLLNPLQSFLGESPWWATAAVLLAVAYILGGWRPAATTLVCELIIFGVGQWHDAMITLAMTLVATLLVMIIAVVLGVSMGRSKRTDTAIRPFLDAFQTIPSMVYLVPALALFSTSRFTAIVAAVAYAIPIATKLVADGIRGVSPTTVEAARSTGSSRWQMISKVQVPMAREALVLAANQGLLYVLSVVVIGGLVGAGSLGYMVVAGFSQNDLFGKGLAAGITLTALGIMLDRITRGAAARYGR
jgi:glycine betaine/proline transport system permease protein